MKRKISKIDLSKEELKVINKDIIFNSIKGGPHKNKKKQIPRKNKHKNLNSI